MDVLPSCKQRWHWNAAEHPTFLVRSVPILAFERLNSSWKRWHSACSWKTHGQTEGPCLSMPT